MDDRKERVILVNKDNRKIGTAPKLAAHEQGLLHRAFSVSLQDAKGNIILQQRAESKYHAPMLWANTCCGHPRPGERTISAAYRRLEEELGIRGAFFLKQVGSMIYRCEVPSAKEPLIEHEYLYLFSGVYNGAITPNPEEVAAYDRVPLDMLVTRMNQHPHSIAPWFRDHTFGALHGGEQFSLGLIHNSTSTSFK